MSINRFFEIVAVIFVHILNEAGSVKYELIIIHKYYQFIFSCCCCCFFKYLFQPNLYLAFIRSGTFAYVSKNILYTIFISINRSMRFGSIVTVVMISVHCFKTPIKCEHLSPVVHDFLEYTPSSLFLLCQRYESSVEIDISEIQFWFLGGGNVGFLLIG